MSGRTAGSRSTFYALALRPEQLINLVIINEEIPGYRGLVEAIAIDNGSLLEHLRHAPRVRFTEQLDDYFPTIPSQNPTTVSRRSRAMSGTCSRQGWVDRSDMDKDFNARAQMSDEDKDVPLECLGAIAHRRAA